MRQPQRMQERLITDYPFGRFWDVKGPARVQSDCVACLGQQLVVATLFPDLTLGTCSLLSPAVLTRDNSHFTRTLFHCLSNSSSSKPQSRFGRGSSVTRRRRRRRQSDRGVISSGPMTPSRLILFYMAMRMSGLKRRSFTLGINFPVSLPTLQHLPLFFFALCLALVPGSTPESPFISLK